MSDKADAPNVVLEISRLFDLDRAYLDEALSLSERVRAGIQSRFDAAALDACHDALDASIMALRAAFYPDAVNVLVRFPHVVVITADDVVIHHADDDDLGSAYLTKATGSEAQIIQKDLCPNHDTDKDNCHD